MKLLIDDANIEAIIKLYDIFPVDGVTTNPSILAANGENPFIILHKIRDFIGTDAQLHVQAVATTAADMIEDAHRIQKELGQNTYIKIPVIAEGLKAIKILKDEGANITATAIYTQMQAYLAAKAGADYAAPYVNRIDNLGADGIKTTRDIQDIFKNNNFSTQILAASFKNSQQVLALCQYGIGASTVAPPVMQGLLKNDCVTIAVRAFVNDFESLCGKNKTMKDC